jgi:hypothetical protein
MMPDACGGHAAPYHFHTKLACEYQESESAQHSPLVAAMLDGVGLYGKWEGGGAAPVLDACNGHTGPVPANAAYGVPSGSTYRQSGCRPSRSPRRDSSPRRGRAGIAGGAGGARAGSGLLMPGLGPAGGEIENLNVDCHSEYPSLSGFFLM